MTHQAVAEFLIRIAEHMGSPEITFLNFTVRRELTGWEIQTR